MYLMNKNTRTFTISYLALDCTFLISPVTTCTTSRVPSKTTIAKVSGIHGFHCNADTKVDWPASNLKFFEDTFYKHFIFLLSKKYTCQLAMRLALKISSLHRSSTNFKFKNIHTLFPLLVFK